MKQLSIKQVRSSIKRTARQKKNLEALGLKKLNQIVYLDARPEILGMVKKVQHLVEVKEI